MRFFDRLSIRVRITLGTLLLALAFFVAAALIGHSLVERLLDDSTTGLLDADIAPFETAIQNEPNDAVDAPADGQLIAVIDPTGKQRVSTLPTSLQRTLGDLTAVSTTPTAVGAAGGHFLVVGEQVRDAAGTWTIVAARDQGTTDEVMSRLTTGLVIALGVIALAFGALSWLLTGSALRPVNRLRKSAESIVASSSNELLPVGPTRDEIRALAQTLNDLIEDLRAAALRERQMVSDASHELRTPLAVLQAQLELMRTGDRSRFDEDILTAETAARRISHLVSELLELSRLETAGAAPGTATTAELVEEAGQAVDRARLAAADRQIDIELEVNEPDGLAASAAIRPATFGRIVDNLVGNATAAVGRTGCIEIALDLSSAVALLTVTDDGPGIDPEFLPRAFDRFSQPDSARGGSAGAGLGLAIVSAAVAKAGGTVTLENRAEGGAKATVRLPLGTGSEAV